MACSHNYDSLIGSNDSNSSNIHPEYINTTVTNFTSAAAAVATAATINTTTITMTTTTKNNNKMTTKLTFRNEWYVFVPGDGGTVAEIFRDPSVASSSPSTCAWFERAP
ncbi:hypothetical protein PoB_001813700 [Plakobranchus ocellatus]|uniref:Uncharacterized protein n=1 Tax=Plakobranchus ocellatus TaxID=259542 RepID=A0AAV3ZAX0_9GAST|nr:hypothetical protein PoB_001813700 [Plakobranchus ocellatus]